MLYIYIYTTKNTVEFKKKRIQTKSNGTVTLLGRTYFSSDSTYLLPNAGYLDRYTVTTHVYLKDLSPNSRR